MLGQFLALIIIFMGSKRFDAIIPQDAGRARLRSLYQAIERLSNLVGSLISNRTLLIRVEKSKSLFGGFGLQLW